MHYCGRLLVPVVVCMRGLCGSGRRHSSRSIQFRQRRAYQGVLGKGIKDKRNATLYLRGLTPAAAAVITIVVTY